jgi:hypothetical protein
MSLAFERPNPLEVLDAVIADLRASGDTGHVENLLQARADVASLVEAIVDETKALIAYQGCDGSGATACVLAKSRVIDALVRFGVTP